MEKKSKNTTKNVKNEFENFKKLKDVKSVKSASAKKTAKKNVVQEDDDTLKIGIVGIGSVGAPIAVLLASKGYDVEITKKNTDDLMIDNRVNIEINGAFGDKSYLVKSVQNNNFTSKKDVIIMCTQAYSTAGALTEVKNYLKPNGVVVSLQNVLNINDVLKVVPKERYVALLIDWTATRIAMNHIVVLRTGEMHVGVFDKKAEIYLPIIQQLLNAIQPTIVHNDMLQFIASRFVLTCTMSSVLAITGHNLKKTLTSKTAKRLIVGTINEMLRVFSAYNVDVPPYRGSLDYYKFTKRGLAGKMYRGKMFYRFVRQNGDMCSSILRALENKKRTELDSMCNRIVEMANERGISVPFNGTIAKFLYDVEEGRETIFMENLTNPIFTKLRIDWR